jgi:hypothetical protein
MTDKCTHILLSHHFFKFIRNANTIQPLKDHLQGVNLVYSNSKFNKINHKM